MRKRTLAREFALQILYQLEINKDELDLILVDFWQKEPKADLDVQEFAAKLVKGVFGNLKSIDESIKKYATNWELDRMAIVDRNILRLGCFELLFLEEIPPKVAINEAVEIAKKFAGVEAGKFVNGILDKIKQERKFKQ
jgi:transcription antitermination factor NusB